MEKNHDVGFFRFYFSEAFDANNANASEKQKQIQIQPCSQHTAGFDREARELLAFVGLRYLLKCIHSSILTCKTEIVIIPKNMTF